MVSEDSSKSGFGAFFVSTAGLFSSLTLGGYLPHPTHISVSSLKPGVIAGQPAAPLLGLGISGC